MSDHKNMDSRGTVAELRALLDKATPGPWEAEEDGLILAGLVDPEMPKRGREIIGTARHHGTLIAALRNAAPDLLRVVEAARKWSIAPSGSNAHALVDALNAVYGGTP